MTAIRLIYLLLSISGAVLTWHYNLQFISAGAGNFDLQAFVAGGMANAASSSLAMDITIAAMTGFVWMIVESRRLGMKNSWLYILSGCMIAFAFAFPFFLFMREGKLNKTRNI